MNVFQSCVNSGNCSLHSSQQLFLSSLGFSIRLKGISVQIPHGLSLHAPFCLAKPCYSSSLNSSLCLLSPLRLLCSSWIPLPFCKQEGNWRTYLTCFPFRRHPSSALPIVPLPESSCFIYFVQPYSHSWQKGQFHTRYSFTAGSRSHPSSLVGGL